MVHLGWQDRDSYKILLSNWNNSDKSIFALSVNDSQEISDIENWFIEKYSGWKIAQASFTSDKEVLKFNLLEMIVYDLGLKNFTNYEHTLVNLESSNRIIISQSIGNQAKAKDGVKYENNTQSVYLASEIFHKSLIFENNVTPILYAFKKDLEVLSKNNKIFLCIKFRMVLADEFSQEFLNWFQDHFLYSISTIPNLKILTIIQGGLEKLTVIDDDQKCYIATLNIEDIHGATKLFTDHYEIFCAGVINPDTKTVEYKDFKRKLALLTKLENV